MEVHAAGTHSTAELAELFSVARSTIYRSIQRQEHLSYPTVSEATNAASHHGKHLGVATRVSH
jgi:predicted DNA-binding transcriptional regulator YafY